tara:strand:+ start:338 stop:850 length:513 start_codon:yes stop_codon:yes gene_type:complete
MSIIPTEVLNIIFEFNPEHRPLFKRCLKRIESYKSLRQIPINGCLSRYKYLLNIFDNQIDYGGNWDMEEIVRKYINDPEIFIRNYSKCKCCERHQILRPTSLYDKSFEYIPNIATIGMIHAGCRCPCRHNSRFIYYTFNNMMDERTPFSTAWTKDMCEKRERGESIYSHN